MIRILTVEREFGSGGNVIAAALAERRGWALWDQRLTDEIARRLDCDRRSVELCEERAASAYYRLFRAFIRGSFEGSVKAPHMRLIDADCIRELTQAIQIEVADTGNC